MTILLAGGGTGGHLFPGIAIAREFLKRDPATGIVFTATHGGMEAEILEREGFAYERIEVRPLKDRHGRQLLASLARMFTACIRSAGILIKLRPDMVIGLGGYLSGPTMLMARLLGMKTAVQEQNVRPGMTNRILGRIVHRIFLGFEEARHHLPKSKSLVTGNPVRAHGEPAAERKDELFHLLILGGSRGAHRINMAMIEALEHLGPVLSGLAITHQTGKADLDHVKDAYGSRGFEARVEGFINDMTSAYRWADLVVCRAGALTLTELADFGKASLLVPYPHSDGHQWHNAYVFIDAGASTWIRDEDLDGERLAGTIRTLHDDPTRLEGLAQNAFRLARPRAAADIVDACLALTARRSNV